MSPEAQWRRKQKSGLAPGLDGEIQLASLHGYLGRFAEAERILARARRKWVNDPRIHLASVTLRQLQGDFSPPTWEDGRVQRRAEDQFPHVPLQTWPRPTLLVKSRQPISHAGEARFTRGITSVSPTFKRRK
jgi:hypothetical protein